MDSQKIVLNVRGIKYEMVTDALRHFPNTRLGRICIKLQDQNWNELENMCDKFTNPNEFYFNRDPYIFNNILNYYESGKLHVSHSECVSLIRHELDYWQVDECELDSCCKLNYFEKINTIEESAQCEEVMRKKLKQQDNFGTKFYPKIRRKIWLLFTDPCSSTLAKIVFVISMLNIILSVIDLIVRTIPVLKLDSDPKNQEKSILRNFLNGIEPVYISWWLIEIVLTFICSPNKIKYVKSFLNIIELICIIPFFVWLFFSKYSISSQWKQIINVLRVFLLLKINRNSSSLKSFIQTMRNSLKELGILFVYLSIGVMFFSSIVYYCEYETQPEQFSSIPAAFWWGLVTMTTVGYGDMSPQTLLGKIFGSLCAVSGVLIVSLPIGIISANFSQTLDREHKTKVFLSVENKLSKIRKRVAYFDSKTYSEVVAFSNRKK